MLISYYPKEKGYSVQKAKDNSSKRILCIEDDNDTCELLGFLLSEYDFKFAHSPKEIFPLIETERFDLYILDNWLPGVSGVDLCKKIRALYPETPIVFTSGISSKAKIQEAFDAGANKYLVKPYEPDELQKIVKELIYNG